MSAVHATPEPQLARDLNVGHASAVVVRAGFSQPLTDFEPRQKGLPMSELSTETVICGMETAFTYVK